MNLSRYFDGSPDSPSRKTTVPIASLVSDHAILDSDNSINFVGNDVSHSNITNLPLFVEINPSKTSRTSNGRRNSLGCFTYKLMKACNFCRKRKVKCITRDYSLVCDNCKNHGKECVIDHKLITKNGDISKKTYYNPGGKKSKDHVSPMSVENFLKSTPNGSESFDNGSRATKSPGLGPVLDNEVSPSSIVLTNNTKSARQSMFELYQSNVEPYTPFVPHEVFETTNYRDLDQFSKCCINIATVSSPNNTIPESAIGLFLDFLNNIMSNNSIQWDETTLACFFLLPLRTVISNEIIEQGLHEFNKLYQKKPGSVSKNLVIGALTIDSWYALFNSKGLTTNPAILDIASSYLESLSKSSFNYHFLYIGFYLYKLLWLIRDESMPYENKKHSILQLEFDMLLWPAKLTTELSVVKDKLIATPEAFILHVLHNTLLTAFYTNAVTNKETYGKVSGISAVPGLYHFISGMAKSNFRVTEEIVGRWSIIADCQIITAKLMLELNESMEFANFKDSLKFFKQKSNSSNLTLQDDVFKRVKYLLSNDSLHENKDDDEVDGAVVFWVFRDTRSMSLQFAIEEEEKRRPSFTQAKIRS